MFGDKAGERAGCGLEVEHVALQAIEGGGDGFELPVYQLLELAEIRLGGGLVEAALDHPGEFFNGGFLRHTSSA